MVCAEHKKCTTGRYSLHQKCLGFYNALVSPVVTIRCLDLMCLTSTNLLSHLQGLCSARPHSLSIAELTSTSKTKCTVRDDIVMAQIRL